MPRQNRVTPFGELFATTARGTLMGNRGCLHDAMGRIRKHHVGQRWILCLLKFKGRHRQIMKPGHFTELFFLDEATGLAAGHRPCKECQKERFNLFLKQWSAANQHLLEGRVATAAILDSELRKEGSEQGGNKVDAIDNLPNGTFVTVNGREAYLVNEGKLFRWEPFGYYSVHNRISGPFQVVTQQSIVNTLRLGFPVTFHESVSMFQRG